MFNENLKDCKWNSAATCWPPQKLSNLQHIHLAQSKNSEKTGFSLFLTEKMNETTSCVRLRIVNGDFALHIIMESWSVSQIGILKNFIETKINFSPSPLWFLGKKKKKEKKHALGFSANIS